MWRQAAHDYADPDHSGLGDPAHAVEDGVDRHSPCSAEHGRPHNAAYAERRISGDPTPSQDDMILTRRLVDAGRLLGVDVLDHIVVGGGRYVSFRERGGF